MAPKSVALLLSSPSFEWFYGERLGLDRATYLDSYRNDWSWEYLAAFRGAGLRPHLYVATQGDGDRVELDDGTTIRFLPLTAADALWWRIPGLRRTRYGRYAWQTANAFALLPALKTALAADRIDTLFVQEYWPARIDTLAGRLEVPLVCIDQGYPGERDLRFRKHKAFSALSAMIVQTREEADKVRRLGGPAKLLPNAVDTERFAFGPSHDRAATRVISVAQLVDEHKRTSDLVRAVAHLGAPWTLELYGSGPDEQMLRTLVLELGIVDRVTFHGFVLDRQKIQDALRACTVFALPSAYEGLPMSLLEAMASGAAVVGTDIPPIANVLNDGTDGVLVPVGDPRALARAIQRAAKNRAALGLAARQTIETRYSLSALGKELSHMVA